MNSFFEELNIENAKNLINNISDNINELQQNFLNSNFGNIINSAVDIGIKTALPNLIEDEVIKIKDTILEEGLKEGVNELIESSLNVGKSAIGIFTGNFENISQIQIAVEKGGLIDGVSDLLDFAINEAKNNKIISNDIAKGLKAAKNKILNTISKDIESNLSNQLDSIEKINTYCEKWNNYYNEQDFDNMEKMYKKIEKEREKIVPFENIIKEMNKIDNLHNLIKNNDKNFNISENDLKLAQILA